MGWEGDSGKFGLNGHLRRPKSAIRSKVLCDQSKEPVQSIVVLPKIAEIIIVFFVVWRGVVSIHMNRKINCLIDTLSVLLRLLVLLWLMLLFLF